MPKILDNLRKELKANSDPKTKQSFQRFFKEGAKCYGVKTGVVGKIAGKYWNQAKLLSKEKIFSLCTKLYSSGFCEEAFVVSMWVPNLTNQFAPSDFKIFENWINKYVDNWAKCDGFCNHTVGNFVQKYPKFVNKLKVWAKSKNRWLKRAATVTLIVPGKQGKFLKDAFEIADILLKDPDDMVQKGYGWLLKEESRVNQKQVFNYVMKNKKEMPRTALRYAIELMPKNLKQKAMEK